MGKYFGTDGIRGIANGDLTPQLAFALGRAAAMALRSAGGRPRFLIGRDTRVSGTMLECAVSSGLASAGGDVVRAGIIPTPAVAFLTRKGDFSAGIVISASHNPVEDNGIKFFSREGFKLSDRLEETIEDLSENPGAGIYPTGAGIGRIEDNSSLAEAYLEYLTGRSRAGLDGFKLVIDCAHGAAHKLAPELFQRLGADVRLIGGTPDGLNINEKCGSTHPETLREEVLREGTDGGIAFDGDADRLIACDEQGNILDGDTILAVCALSAKERHVLPGDAVVATVMSNLGLDATLLQKGIKVHRATVGDRFVLEEMRRRHLLLGGEQSGHLIFLGEDSTTGDGLLTALQLLAARAEMGVPLSTLCGLLQRFPQVLKSVRVKDKNRIADNNRIREAVKEVEKRLGRNGRVVLRPSGTEPMVRVMVESRDREEAENIADMLAQMAQRELA